MLCSFKQVYLFVQITYLVKYQFVNKVMVNCSAECVSRASILWALSKRNGIVLQ